MEIPKSQKESFEFSGKGTVYSYTTVYEAPKNYEHNVPYTVALVKLEEGPVVTSQLTDYPKRTEKVWVNDWDGVRHKDVEVDDVNIGDQVEMVTRKMRYDEDEREMIVYGYKFRPPVDQD